MLTISGLKRFYYIPGVTDMRCGYSRLLQITEWIGQLYGFEDEYKLQDLPPDEIKRRRNDSRTTDIMIAMSTRLNELLLDENAHLGALYHTFIAARPMVACMARTCQMMELSVLKYFKNLFAAIAAGRADYENMLPMTLGVCKAV